MEQNYQQVQNNTNKENDKNELLQLHYSLINNADHQQIAQYAEQIMEYYIKHQDQRILSLVSSDEKLSFQE